MRVALVFPPQWDPRQPPLGLPVLAGALGRAGQEVRIFDLNLSLYRNLLTPAIPGGIEAVLQRRLLDERLLADAPGYLHLTAEVQKLFDIRFDPQDGSTRNPPSGPPAGKGYRLFWDTCGGPLSPGASAHWKQVLADPEGIPFLGHLRQEVAGLVAWKPDLIGFSIISDTQILAALALAAHLRTHLPAARLVAGGDALAYRRSLLPGLGWLGAVFEGVGVGEGEPFLLDLVAGTPAGEAAGGLSWDAAGAPRAGPWGLADLKTAASPDFEKLPLDGYLTPRLVMPVETARGCPWGHCAFCIHPMREADGRSLYRPKPLELVREHLEALVAAGHRRFFVVDEALPPARFREMSALFQGLPVPVSWICYLRLDAGHDRDSFARARASGCRKCFIGLESGSDRLLERFRKGLNVAVARRVLLDLAAAGIAPHLFLMTGFPGEIEDDRLRTLALLEEVLPAIDPFGFSYDLFALSAELETEFLADPQRFGWQAPARTSGNDLAYQLPVVTGRAAIEAVRNYQDRLAALADRLLGPAFGLRHAGLAQDSLHLLLLEARSL